jgi:hypothetical protein
MPCALSDVVSTFGERPFRQETAEGNPASAMIIDAQAPPGCRRFSDGLGAASAYDCAPQRG